MLKIEPIETPKIIHLRCPDCNKRIPNVGLLKDQSQIEGLIFRCKKCECLYSVTTTVTTE